MTQKRKNDKTTNWFENKTLQQTSHQVNWIALSACHSRRNANAAATQLCLKNSTWTSEVGGRDLERLDRPVNRYCASCVWWLFVFKISHRLTCQPPPTLFTPNRVQSLIICEVHMLWLQNFCSTNGSILQQYTTAYDAHFQSKEFYLIPDPSCSMGGRHRKFLIGPLQKIKISDYVSRSTPEWNTSPLVEKATSSENTKQTRNKR
jgi:hypothetical protein